MRQDKKVVDLIHIHNASHSHHLREDYQTKIKVWQNWLKNLDNEELYGGIGDLEKANEFFMVNQFFKQFLDKRFQWILNHVESKSLQHKYLLVLPPFSQKGGLKNLLLHFFQLEEVEDNNQLVFNKHNTSEREVRILWDIYKILKTRETIKVLQKAAREGLEFAPSFTLTEIEALLKPLEETFEIIIQLCLKPQYRKGFIKHFPQNAFDPEEILKRKETNDFYVPDITLDKLDYRNYIFFVYYGKGIKLNQNGVEKEFRFNFLDFEIIKQEYLIHWLRQRLKNNPKKEEVLSQYMLGEQTLAQRLADNPSMEITILKQLPTDKFNDIIAGVNEVVEPKDQIDIDPMSENIGEFAKYLQVFDQAKGFAKKSIQALQESIKGLKKQFSNLLAPKELEPLKPYEATPIKKSNFKFTKLEKDEINFPFFVERAAMFTRQHSLMKMKMLPERYSSFKTTINHWFNSMSPDCFIIRRTPRHEWVRPYQIEETKGKEKIRHLLILGAEAKAQQLSMGYKSNMEEQYDLSPYFLYGTSEINPEMGAVLEERKVFGDTYYIYDFGGMKVIPKALALLERILQEEKEG